MIPQRSHAKARNIAIADAKAFVDQFLGARGGWDRSEGFALAIHARISSSITGKADEAMASR